MASDAYLRAVDAVQEIKDTDEIHKLNRMIREQFNHLTRQKTREFRVGEEVTFKTKRGPIMKGTVTKINRKTIGVLTDTHMDYRVSPSLLKKV